MINQTRTVLLNKAASFFNQLDGAVYVPPSFSTVVLPAELKAVYDTLFPVSSDAYVLSDLGAAILQVLHAPELNSYALYNDSRITYDVATAEPSLLSPITMNFEVSATDIVPHYKLHAAGLPSALRFAGVHIWRCSRVNSFTLAVSYNKQTGSDTYHISTGSTRSNLIPLFPEYLDLYFDMPSRQLTGTFLLQVQLDIAPVFDFTSCFTALNTLVKQSNLLPRLYAPVNGYTTQLAQLKDVYLNSPEAVLQFGALVLAYTYQCLALQPGNA